MIPPSVEISSPTKQLLADESNIYIQNLKQQIAGLDAELPIFFHQLDSLVFTNSLLRASAIKARFYRSDSILAKVSKDFDESVNLLRDYNAVDSIVKSLLDQITDIMSQIINEYCYEVESSNNWIDLQNKLFDQIQEHLLLNLNNLEILQVHNHEPFNLDDIPEAKHLFDIDFDIDVDTNTDINNYDAIYPQVGTHLNEIDGFLMIELENENENNETEPLEWVNAQELLELDSTTSYLTNVEGNTLDNDVNNSNVNNSNVNDRDGNKIPMPKMLAEIFAVPANEHLLGSDDETEIQGVKWDEEDITTIQEDLQSYLLEDKIESSDIKGILESANDLESIKTPDIIKDVEEAKVITGSASHHLLLPNVEDILEGSESIENLEDLDDPWSKFSNLDDWSSMDDDELSTLAELEASFTFGSEVIAYSGDNPMDNGLGNTEDDDEEKFWQSLESISDIQVESLASNLLEEIPVSNQPQSSEFLSIQEHYGFSTPDVDTAIEESPIYQNHTNTSLDWDGIELLNNSDVFDTSFHLESSSSPSIDPDLTGSSSMSLDNELRKVGLDVIPENDHIHHSINADSTIRLPVNHLEMLGDLSEELVVRKGSLDIYLGEIKAYSGEACKSLQLLESDSHRPTAIANLQSNLEQILGLIDLTEHQSYVMGQDVRELRKNLRQVLKHPISSIVRKYPRILRDLALLYGNQVELIVKGAEISIERSLSELIAEPLELLLRNAVEYGIETPSERQRLNKSPQGKIEIMATQTEEGTIIKVSDDGRGIDLDKIRHQLENSAMIAGVPDFSTIETSDEQLMDLLFDANFNISSESYTGNVLRLSDIRKKLRDVGGKISVQSQKAEGTEFTIVLPNLLALVRVMLIDINQMCLAIPSKVVLEVIPVASNVLDEEGQMTMLWRDREIPILRLNSILKLNCRHNVQQVEDPKSSPLVDFVEGYKPANAVAAFLIIHHDNYLFALQTDGCWNEQDATFHHIEGDIALPPIFQGTVILGSNQAVALIEPAELVAEASRIDIQESTSSQSSQISQGIDNLKILSDFFGGDVAEISHSSRQSIVERSPEPENLESSGLLRSALENRSSKRSHHPKVLIVESSANVRRYLAMTLAKSGFMTEQVQDGNEAFVFLKDQLRHNLEIDVVITDLELPHMDGFKLLTNIRADESLNQIPVIVLNSRNNEHDQKLALELGANAYFSKPYREQELVATLQNIIQSP